MILDLIDKADMYSRINNRFGTAFQMLQKPELLAAENGRYELQGVDLVALVQHYITKPKENDRWEAHRRYIDLQYIVAGAEMIGCANLSGMKITEPYDEANDILFLEGAGNFFTLSTGMFGVFFPHDAHMPMLAVNAPAPVHKIVLKIRIE